MGLPLLRSWALQKYIVFFCGEAGRPFTCVFLCSQLFELLWEVVKWVIQKSLIGFGWWVGYYHSIG